MPETVVAVVRCEDSVETAVAEALSLVPSFKDALGARAHALVVPDIEYIHHDAARITSPLIIQAVLGLLQCSGVEASVGDGSKSTAWWLWRAIRHRMLMKLAGRFEGKSYPEIADYYHSIMNARRFDDLCMLEIPGIEKPLISREELVPETSVEAYRRSGLLECIEKTGGTLRCLEIECSEPSRSATDLFIARPIISRFAAGERQVISMPLCFLDKPAGGWAVKNIINVVPAPLREPYERTADMSGMTAAMYTDVYAALQPPVLALSDVRTDSARKTPEYIAASADCVAHDAVIARIAGLDPMNVQHIRTAYEAGAGEGRLEHVEIRGIGLDEIPAGKT